MTDGNLFLEIEDLTYEDYLNKEIRAEDLFYLQDEKVARQLVELGFRGSLTTLKKEEFLEEKRKIEEAKNPVKKPKKVLSSTGKEQSPFLQELAKREADIRSGKLTCIIFLRTKNKRGHEVSGYIDYAHRLATEDFAPYFNGSKFFLPRNSDLSYYNWETQVATSGSTPNFQVIADPDRGLIFKNKRDRKVIVVDPKMTYLGDNSTRMEIESTGYDQIIFFDHNTRRKA